MKKTHKICPKCGSRKYVLLKGYKILELHEGGKILKRIHTIVTGYPKFVCLKCEYAVDANDNINELARQDYKAILSQEETKKMLRNLKIRH